MLKLKPVPVPPDPLPPRRRAPGRGNELSPLEREAANRLWVQGASKSEIARQLNCSTAAIRRALSCRQGEEFREDARTELRKRRGQFVADWCRASEIASGKGDHRAARDALIACHEVDPQPTAGGAVMQVAIVNGDGRAISLPGLPAPTTIAAGTPLRALPSSNDR